MKNALNVNKLNTVFNLLFELYVARLKPCGQHIYKKISEPKVISSP